MFCAQVAQLVEQRTENPRVGGSISPCGTIFNEIHNYITYFLYKHRNNGKTKS